jgi:nicotinamide-nucleotide amidase
MFSVDLTTLAAEVIKACKKKHLGLATAESCTGGLIAGCLTAVSGASDVLQHGIVTYSNDAKTRLLGVPVDLLMANGAVSEDVSRAMAEGALLADDIDISVSVTGIAGPGGGSAEKPVGLVHISVARTGYETLHERHIFDGDRNDVRQQTIKAALKLLIKRIDD